MWAWLITGSHTQVVETVQATRAGKKQEETIIDPLSAGFSKPEIIDPLSLMDPLSAVLIDTHRDAGSSFGSPSKVFMMMSLLCHCRLI